MNNKLKVLITDCVVDSAFSLEPFGIQALLTETERAWQALGVVRYGATDAEKNH